MILIYLKPYTKQLILGPLAKLLEAVLELMLPMLMAQLIDVGINLLYDVGYVVRTVIYMAVFTLVGCASSVYCQYSASVASQGYGTTLRNAYVAKINGLSHKDLERFGNSTLLTRATSDVNNVQHAVAMFIRLVTRVPFICIGSLVMSFVMDWRLALILTAFIAVFVLVTFLVMRKTLPRYRKTQEKLDGISTSVKENLGGVRVVRAFNESGAEEKRFASANDAWAKAALRAGRLASLMSPITALVLNSAVVAVLWFGGGHIDTGLLKQGELVAFINYITQVTLALSLAANLTVMFMRALASGGRIAEIMKLDPSVTAPAAPSAPVRPEPYAAAVAFNGVSFDYGGGDALKDISFAAARGESIGIVGGTGAGKSTLVKLLPRFYDASGGEIKVFGVPVKEYAPEELRAKIGYVPQKAGLFPETVRENLVLGRAVTDAGLALALETAQAADFVAALPDGLDTAVARGGANFSGGQRQRLTVARALCANPDILVLDDSLSALDYITDRKLRRALAKNYAGTTVIIVSQRVSAVRDCSQILVLENGGLVGIGSHDSLMRLCPLYRSIYNSQNKEEIA
ncbi:MAG: ABC transporter ATP-binding protein/permease [Clostridiales bacterium]|nr:ABC transporter ATP-binding protein/permease [Clostridiales bacterium]